MMKKFKKFSETKQAVKAGNSTKEFPNFYHDLRCAAGSAAQTCRPAAQAQQSTTVNILARLESLRWSPTDQLPNP